MANGINHAKKIVIDEAEGLAKDLQNGKSGNPEIQGRAIGLLVRMITPLYESNFVIEEDCVRRHAEGDIKENKLNTVINWQEQHDRETAEAIKRVHFEADTAVEKVKNLAVIAVKVADTKRFSLSMEYIFGNWKRIGITLGGIVWITVMTYTSLKSASAEQLNKVIQKVNTVIQDINEKR